jgi:hypothetical protein
MGEWRYSSTILHLGTRWRWMVRFTPRPLYPWRKSSGCPFDRRMAGPQSRSGQCGVKSLNPARNRNPAVQPVACRYLGSYTSSLVFILKRYLNTPLEGPKIITRTRAARRARAIPQACCCIFAFPWSVNSPRLKLCLITDVQCVSSAVTWAGSLVVTSVLWYTSPSCRMPSSTTGYTTVCIGAHSPATCHGRGSVCVCVYMFVCATPSGLCQIIISRHGIATELFWGGLRRIKNAKNRYFRVSRKKGAGIRPWQRCVWGGEEVERYF